MKKKKKKRNKCCEFLKHFGKPMSIMIWLAVLIEALQFHWMNFAVFCTIQAINGLFSWYAESEASDAIEALRKNWAPKCNVNALVSGSTWHRRIWCQGIS